MGRKLTTAEFIEMAIGVHGDKYDYFETVYVGGRFKLNVICKLHNFKFQQKARNHLDGQGCPKCAGQYSPSTVEFIQSSMLVHCDKYDYSQVNYVNNCNKVTIRCKQHDFVFSQSPNKHLQGKGCHKCAGQYRPSTSEFIESCRNVHGDKYDYSLVRYVNNKTDVIIKCNKHGFTFKQSPCNHLAGKGCQACSIVGFNVDKGAYFYVLVFKSFVGFGISGKYSSRLRTHVKNAGGEIPISEHLRWFDVGAHAKELESQLKRKYKGVSSVRGFLTESTTLENLTLLLKDVSDFKI